MTAQEQLIMAIGIASGLRARYRKDGDTFTDLINAIARAYLKIGGERRMLVAHRIAVPDDEEEE